MVFQAPGFSLCGLQVLSASRGVTRKWILTLSLFPVWTWRTSTTIPVSGILTERLIRQPQHFPAIASRLEIAPIFDLDSFQHR